MDGLGGRQQACEAGKTTPIPITIGHIAADFLGTWPQSLPALITGGGALLASHAPAGVRGGERAGPSPLAIFSRNWLGPLVLGASWPCWAPVGWPNRAGAISETAT